MANKFPIDITARDRTAEALKSVNANFGKLAQGTPLHRVAGAFKDITERGTAFGKIGRAIGDLNLAGRAASGGIGEAAGAAVELEGALGLIGVGAAGAVSGLAAAAAAAATWQVQYSRAGAAVGFQAKVMGISVETLQEYQIAGAKAGVSADAMAGSMQNLGNVLQDYAAGRVQDPKIIAMMKMMNMKEVPRLKNGSVDVAKAIDLLANGMHASNAETRQMIANLFSVGSAISFLIQDEATREAELAAARRSGAIRSQQQQDDDLAVTNSVLRLHDAWHGLLNRLSEKLVIPWLQPTLDKMNDLIDGTHTVNLSTRLMNIPLRLAGGLYSGMTGAGGKNAAPRTGGSGDKGASPTGPLAGVPNQFTDLPAGVQAALWSESKFDPYVHNTQKGGRGAWGVGQWRRSRLDDFRAVFGHDISRPSGNRDIDLAEQRRFIDWELAHTHQAARSALQPGISDKESRNRWLQLFEIPGPAGMAQDTRQSDRMLASGGAGAVNGHVHVTVDVRGAPPGSTVTAQASGQGVTAAAAIGRSLPGGPT